MTSVEYRVFLVEDRELVELDEATLGARLPAFRGRLNVLEVLAGSLRIQADGQPTVEVLEPHLTNPWVCGGVGRSPSV